MNQLARVGWCVCVWGIVLSVPLVAQELVIRSTPDLLQVSAPKLHFLTGKPLERLKSGNSVPFDFHLSLLTDNKQAVLRQSFERFLVSYDIWEEKFSVSRLRGEKATASLLSATSAEAWCLDKLSLPASGLPPNKLVWVRLDIRAHESRTLKPLTEEEGLSLTSLIEMFSRSGKQAGNHWRLESGPMQLSDIRKTTGRTGF